MQGRLLPPVLLVAAGSSLRVGPPAARWRAQTPCPTKGVREPHIYGSTTLAAVHKSCKEFVVYLGASLIFEQSNYEGVLVEMIQSARTTADAIIIILDRNL